MYSKLVLTSIALLYGIVGAAWFIVPDPVVKFWGIAPGENFTNMGLRYRAFLLALAEAV